MHHFKAPEKTFPSLDPDSAAALVEAAADFAVVLDAEGKILDWAGREWADSQAPDDWIGRTWADTVTVESRVKIEELLNGASEKSEPRWRQVNHPTADGADRPVLYCAIQIGSTGHIVGLGRDISQISEIQQRLVAAQRSLEEHYARIRDADARFHVLFQNAPDAILSISAPSEEILNANGAAERLLGRPAKRLTGRSLVDATGKEAATALRELMQSARETGEAGGMVSVTSDGQTGGQTGSGAEPVRASVAYLREDAEPIFIIRLADSEIAASNSPDTDDHILGAVAEQAPDAIVFADLSGRIRRVNGAFLSMAQLSSERQAVGETIDNWLGRTGVDFGVLVNNLDGHGKLERFSTVMRGQMGSTMEVEISAVPVTVGDVAGLGLLIRRAAPGFNPKPAGPATPQPSESRLRELIGRLSLKEIVRDTADEIERMCLLAALELTKDNRAAAAELLGLSRQSLYVKLRRYGLGERESPE